MKQQVYAVNIGLNVGGIEPENQLSETVRIAGLQYFEVRDSEYDGTPERVVVGHMYLFPEIMETFIQSIALLLNQDCIAVVPDGDISQGRLIWNPYHRGQVFDFNPDYFIPLM